MKRLDASRFIRDYAAYILIVIGIGLVVIVIVALLGPTTGNIFSNIYSNAPGNYGPSAYRADAYQSPVPPPAAPAPGTNSTPAAASSGNTVPVALPNTSAGAPYRVNRLIIKNGEMNLIVADTDRALDQITSVAVEAGGYVIGSRSWQQDTFKYAALTIGVPVDQFEAVQRRLRGLAAQVVSDTAPG